ncbi:MAG: FAD-binding oxidoreductase [Dehalococcoidales bacterium]|nr:FAD-binding oxidoreductase [Dehalococcoidales bacterium]
MSIRDKLAEIAGTKNFSDSATALQKYATDYSLTPKGKANYVVKVKNAEQIQRVITLANENLMPVVPVSSSVHFNGCTIPKQGGIIMDLTGMNKILEIDELNRRVRIEPGVTWGQLHKELQKKGLRMMMPLLPHPDRSVVTDHLERVVITNTVYDYGEPTQSMEIVWPNGDLFRMGSASVPGYPDSPSKGGNPSGPGLDFYRFVQGAQGTMGVVTWANLKMQKKPALDKILFSPVQNLNRVIDFLYRVLRIRIGQEVLLLDSNNLAAILGDTPDEFTKLRETLPPWTLVMVLSAPSIRPEEKIKYELDALKDILNTEFTDIPLTENLPGFPGLGDRIFSLLRQPWPDSKVYWKNRVKGGCQSLTFITKPSMVPEMINIADLVAAEYGYPIVDIGRYVQPIEHNRACQVEFNFFFNPSDEAEKATILSLHDQAARLLLDEGAVFPQPYGSLAPMVYERAAGYTIALKRLKKIFDPNNIMNPGNLCF